MCIVAAWIVKGYARRADTSHDVTGKVWVTPHFGVYNKEKGKWRVVQDYSVRYTGRCLNDELLQGPDMINSLTGVLLRFRKEPVTLMGDIETMYHQVFVPESQRCFLRFLWWPDGNILGNPVDHEMCVHPFGAVSSGGCANFTLKKTASDSSLQFWPEVADILCRDFYIDDLLKSTTDASKAKMMIRAARGLCAEGGFNLTKFI